VGNFFMGLLYMKMSAVDTNGSLADISWQSLDMWLTCPLAAVALALIVSLHVVLMLLAISLYTLELLEAQFPAAGLIYMSRNDLICLILAILGVVLFLYGSNYYNAILGWSGVFLIVAAILAEVALEVYAYIRKREVG